ncbi:deoxyribodipyrimidine photolyase [Halovivax ruber XH-70]|uniref:Deoxyribodipyrimidine photolyase n=1 Tax=Halovivax ruber (strain DSM 18193 / JCM 13892 / XH-70) TaxID=797302 RepID=L0IGV1_HALRX|nr:deoxyribodipyrimidine photo-lyase [Halovivax ruber]AGB17451.1 deoxyribodipyrimidine photolyase [Halovivax ruber XH-70]
MRVHWHRQDLRTADNRGLSVAAADEALPVFVFDPDVLKDGSPPRVAFMLDALARLRARYRDLESDLVVAWGDPAEAIPELVAEYGADGVVWNEDYTGLSRARDERVQEAITDAGGDVERVHDAVCHEPGAITTSDGKPYAVFSYYGTKWLDREKDEPVPEPDAGSLATVEPADEALPSLRDLGFAEPAAEIPPAGTGPARDRLETFCAGDIYEYAEKRDDLADEATARISQDLAFGTIGIREVHERVEATLDGADEGQAASVEAFRRQLAWREFYTQVLWANPENVTRSHREFPNDIDWRNDEAEFDAWREGRTGFPVVDAGMRQLREEAYVHNRARLIVGSFLTKDLLCDWRRGYEHFRATLVDHDTASNNGNWQWVASTGTDAQPYFRVFNPMKQGRDHDPDAEYIRRYVPELEGVDAETIHSWHELDPDERAEVAPDYPAPIVDHASRREEAISTFERARGEGE